MDNAERKAIVAQLLKQGRTPAEIQEYLRKEKGDSITYMELRLLLSEMEAKLPDQPTKQFEPLKASPITAPAGPPPPAPAKGKAAPSPAAAGAKARRRTTVSIDEAPPPGAMLSGRVTFGSGAKAYWVLDESGRIGLDPELGTGRPDQQDMQEFQTELRRLLEQAQGGAF